MKNKLWIILSALIVLFLLLLTAYGMGTRSAKRIAVDLAITEGQNRESQPHKYQFMPKEISDYICSLCEELEVDSDLAVSHLMTENPELDVDAVHLNINGTVDCGLWQLNDRYLWTSFKDAYWFENVELNPFNWKHNTYIAIHHIAYLQKKMKVTDDAIMAYNCGIVAVMSGNIPESTKTYLKKVKTNLYLLERGEQ